MPLAKNYPLDQFSVQTQTTSIGATPVAAYTCMPARGKITGLKVTLKGAITTANASLAVTVGGITVGGSPFIVPFSGSGAAVVTQFDVSGPQVFSEGDAIVITPSAASGATIGADFIVTGRRTAA